MKNTMKKLTALAAASALTLSLAACGGGTATNTQSSNESTAPTGGVTETSASAIRVAVVKQMDHASLDEIANAITARLDEIAAETGTPIEYEVYSGQNDQTVLRQLGDQAIADGVSVLIPIATTAAQVMTVCAEETQTPVVFAAISDPAAADLTGFDYVTGTSDALDTNLILDMIFAQDPDAAKIGLLYSLSEPNSATPDRRRQGLPGRQGRELCGGHRQHQRRGHRRRQLPHRRGGGRHLHPRPTT